MSHGPRSACPALCIVRKVQDTVQSKAGHEAQCHHKGPTLGLVHPPVNHPDGLKEVSRAVQDVSFCWREMPVRATLEAALLNGEAALLG